MHVQVPANYVVVVVVVVELQVEPFDMDFVAANSTSFLDGYPFLHVHATLIYPLEIQSCSRVPVIIIIAAHIERTIRRHLC